MTPTIIFDFPGLTVSIKVDSNSFFYRYSGHYYIYICVSPMCYCGQDIETTTHFLLHCPNYHCARKTLFHKINQVYGTILRQSDSTVAKILLFSDNKLDFETNITDISIEFISLTERFSCPLFE